LQYGSFGCANATNIKKKRHKYVMQMEIEQQGHAQAAQPINSQNEQAREKAVQQMLQQWGVSKADYAGVNPYEQLAQRVYEKTNEFNREGAVEGAKRLIGELAGAFGQEKLDNYAHFYFGNEKKIDNFLAQPDFFIGVAKELVKEFKKFGSSSPERRFSFFCQRLIEMGNAEALMQAKPKTMAGLLSGVAEDSRQFGEFMKLAASMQGALGEKQAQKFWKSFLKISKNLGYESGTLTEIITRPELSQKLQSEPKLYLKCLEKLCNVSEMEGRQKLISTLATQGVYWSFVENPQKTADVLLGTYASFREVTKYGKIETPGYAYVLGALKSSPVLQDMFYQDPEKFREFVELACSKKEGALGQFRVELPKFAMGITRTGTREGAGLELYEFAKQLQKNEVPYLAAFYGTEIVQQLETKEERLEKVKEMIGVFRDKLGIEFLYRYQQDVIENVYRTATDPEFSKGKKLALIITAKSDYNGAFEKNWGNYSELIRNGYCLTIAEAALDTEVGERVKTHGGLGESALGKRKYDFLALGAHGTREGMAFSDTFSGKGSLDMLDVQKLGGKAAWSDYLSENAVVALWSCSTGAISEGTKDPFLNMKGAIRDLAQRKVFAPVADASIDRILYDDKGNVNGMNYYIEGYGYYQSR